MIKVELIYDKECPNVEDARSELREGCLIAGIKAEWIEWERSDPAAPPYASLLGSPAVVINGKDVAYDSTADANCCRVYRSADGTFQGVPDRRQIALAIEKAIKAEKAKKGFVGALLAIPALIAAAMPFATCPACIPLYAGLLSAVGLGVLIQKEYLFWFTAFLLGISLFGMVYKARSRRGYAPAFLGLIGATVMMVGKFAYSFLPATYFGAVLIIAASIWNLYPVSCGQNCGVGGKCQTR